MISSFHTIRVSHWSKILERCRLHSLTRLTIRSLCNHDREKIYSATDVSSIRSVTGATRRGVQVGCRYTLLVLAAPLSLSLSPMSLGQLLSLISARPLFLLWPPSLSAPRIGICEINARDRSPRIPLVENAYLQDSYAIATYLIFAQDLIAFLWLFRKLLQLAIRMQNNFDC